MNANQILGQLPENLREELLEEFNGIVTNFRESKWETSEMKVGKFCEIVYSILKGYIDGSYPNQASKPRNIVTSCQQLEQASSTFPRSVRIQVPRVLIGLYEIRNNRGVGHVGGEVSSNQMDATMVFYSAKWILAELVRVFHDTDTVTANTAIETIIEREIPLVWNIDGKKRILYGNFTMKEKVLILLYSTVGSVKEDDIVSWVEHSNPSVFRRDVLRKGHKEKLWEYDEKKKIVNISPKGIQKTEAELIGEYDFN